MPRPLDLPQPVRPHSAHGTFEDMLKYECSPGPARYNVDISENNQRLVSFPTAVRFSDNQLVPGDNLSSHGRSSYLEHPGPKYSPKWMDTKLSISFGRAPRLSTRIRRSGCSADDKSEDNIQRDSTPGPGEYDTRLKWDKSVSILGAGKNDDCWINANTTTPGPAAYSAEKPPIRNRCARIISASPVTVTRKKTREDSPSMPSMEVIDKALSITRNKSAAISFPKAGRNVSTTAPRMNQIDSSLDSGYDIEMGERLVWRNIKGGKFGMAPRLKDIRVDSNARLRALPPADIESTKSSAPAIQFTRAQYRGDMRGYGCDGPGLKYTPIIDAVHPNPKGVLRWHPRHSTRAHLTRSNTSEEISNKGPDFIEAKSTLDGPSISFPQSRRPQSVYGETGQSNPGPGDYTPDIGSTKRNPKSTVFGTKKREVTRHRSNRNRSGDNYSMGGLYNPDYTVTRPKGCVNIIMSRANRKLKIRSQTCGPSIQYSTNDEQTRRHGRSAILYLTS